MKKTKLLIFITLLIIVLIIFYSCGINTSGGNIIAELTLVESNQSTYSTEDIISFNMSLNLPLAKIRGNRANLVVTNIFTEQPISPNHLEMNIIDSSTIRFNFKPDLSGRYSFFGEFTLSGSDEKISTNQINLLIEGKNAKINNITMLNENSRKRELKEEENTDVFVVQLREREVTLKLDFDINMEDTPSVDIRIENIGDPFERNIERVSEFSFHIGPFQNGFFRNTVRLYDSLVAPHKVIDSRNMIFIVSDDTEPPAIRYIRSNRALETIDRNEIKVSTTQPFYDLKFEVFEDDFEFSGLYNVEAYLVEGKLEERLIFEKKYSYGTEKETINVNLDTDFRNQIIRIYAEDFVGNSNTETYTINITKIPIQTLFTPHYLSGQQLEFIQNENLYEIESLKPIDFIAQVDLGIDFEDSVFYSFVLKDEKGLEIKREENLSQNRIKFSNNNLLEGRNIFSLDTIVKNIDGERVLVDNDSLEIKAPDTTPPLIDKIRLRHSNGATTINYVSGEVHSIDFPNESKGNAFFIDVIFKDRSNIEIENEIIFGELSIPNITTPFEIQFLPNIDLNDKKVLTINMDRNYTNPLINGFYHLLIYGNQIYDEQGNSMEDQNLDYNFYFEVK